MAIVQNLSVLAVRALFEGFCKSIGFEAGAAAADAAVKFLGNRFTDHAARLSNAPVTSRSSMASRGGSITSRLWTLIRRTM